jgi:hypothetical protein
VTCFLELFYWEQRDKKHFLKLLKKYRHQYPDYFLFRVIDCFYSFSNSKELDTENKTLTEMGVLLSQEKQPITYYEYSYFLFLLSALFSTENGKKGFAKIKAYENYILNLRNSLYKPIADKILHILTMLKIIKLFDYFNETTE